MSQHSDIFHSKKRLRDHQNIISGMLENRFHLFRYNSLVLPYPSIYHLKASLIEHKQ